MVMIGKLDSQNKVVGVYIYCISSHTGFSTL